MDPLLCAYCGEEIPPHIIAARHYSSGNRPKRIFCSHEHANAYRQQHGEYKQMSVKGKDARSAAVKKSNQAHPRRRKKRNP